MTELDITELDATGSSANGAGDAGTPARAAKSTWSYNPAAGFPKVVPILLYDDVETAIAWLGRVFGSGLGQMVGQDSSEAASTSSLHAHNASSALSQFISNSSLPVRRPTPNGRSRAAVLAPASALDVRSNMCLMTSAALASERSISWKGGQIPSTKSSRASKASENRRSAASTTR